MNKRIRVGIFFGGPSREREISFAGGRTVYDNLNKAIFEPVPIFVDSLGNFILLDWRFLYQGSIRDFYPPSEFLPPSQFQVYIESLGKLSEEALLNLVSRVGKWIFPQQFKDWVDIAFLALHGPYGEDGNIQGLLEWYHIPYTGSGILANALGIDKLYQKSFMQQAGFNVVPYHILAKSTWQYTLDKAKLLQAMIHLLGLPFVIKSPRQGSSIGVVILSEQNLDAFIQAVNSCFFIEEITGKDWSLKQADDKYQWLTQLTDLRSGIGFPVQVQDQVIEHPDKLWTYLDQYFMENPDAKLALNSLQGEDLVLIEKFIRGQEFSCIVLQETGQAPIALPPTEMLKGDMHFDYRAKYLPGLVRKETPMRVSASQLNNIRKACTDLYKFLGCQVYARIDGILTPNQEIYLNDPNTTAGMHPSSFLFHQAAEIGLNPSQLLTFIIRNSLAERIKSYKVTDRAKQCLATIDAYLSYQQKASKEV
jgi:D-alanine--D-alanine ligase